MEFQTAKQCKTGGRENNQDYAGYMVLEAGRCGCWVVADGLGGHLGGETASKTVVEEILGEFEKSPRCSPEAVMHYLETAQAGLIRAQQSQPRLARMRTTVVILLTDFENVVWGHIGDSRLYYFADGILQFQTRDHSVPQSMVAAGEITPSQIRHHEDRNRLLRSMGQADRFLPEVHEQKQPIYHGDAFLLCTDGFWEYVEETEMEIDFAKALTPGQWLEKMENRVLRKAEGEYDNYTALAVYFDCPSRPRPFKAVPLKLESITGTVVTPPQPVSKPSRISRVPLIISALALLVFLVVWVSRDTEAPEKPAGPVKPPVNKTGPVPKRGPVPGTPAKPGQLSIIKVLKHSPALELTNIKKQNLEPGYFISDWQSLMAKITNIYFKGAGKEQTYILIVLGKIHDTGPAAGPGLSFLEKYGVAFYVSILLPHFEGCSLIVLDNNFSILCTTPGIDQAVLKLIRENLEKMQGVSGHE